MTSQELFDENDEVPSELLETASEKLAAAPKTAAPTPEQPVIKAVTFAMTPVIATELATTAQPEEPRQPSL